MLNIDLSLIIMLYIATQSQDQTSEPHSTITVKDATPGTLPMVELKGKMQCHIIDHILCVFCL